MHKLQRTVLASALLLASSAGLAQAADTGWYVGAGVGRSNYSIDFDRQVRHAYAGTGDAGNADYEVDWTDVRDDADTAWKATLGYRFLPWLGVELAWVDLGTARTDFRLNSTRPLVNGSATAHGHYDLNGATLALNADYPIGESFAIGGRVGLFASNLDYDETGTTVTGAPYSFHADGKDQTKAFAGLGATWHVGEHWDVRLDWDRYFGVGERFALNETGNGRFGHVDAYTVNLFYRFGH